MFLIGKKYEISPVLSQLCLLAAEKEKFPCKLEFVSLNLYTQTDDVILLVFRVASDWPHDYFFFSFIPLHRRPQYDLLYGFFLELMLVDTRHEKI